MRIWIFLSKIKNKKIGIYLYFIEGWWRKANDWYMKPVYMLMLIELKNKKKRRKKSSYCDLRNVLQRMKRKHVQSQKDMEIITKKKREKKKRKRRFHLSIFKSNLTMAIYEFTRSFTSHFYRSLYLIFRLVSFLSLPSYDFKRKQKFVEKLYPSSLCVLSNWNSLRER